jgi:NitT/TauT family transport system substrate-binding protein
MIILAHAHDVPLVILAPAAVYDPRTPDCVLLVPASSAIRSPRDLVGKTIGVASLNSVMTVAVQAWLDASGVSSASTQFVEIPYSQMGQALARGRVDATTPVKPFIADAVASGDARVAYPIYSAISSHFLESVWFANRDFVAKHQGAIAAFARTVAQASTYTNAHQADTVDLLSMWANIDPDRASRMQRIVTGSVLDARDIQPVIDAYATYKLIPKPFPAREIIVDR